jgi:hypothetical protein
MQRAFNNVFFEPSVAQQSVGMSANIVRGINLTVDVVERNIQIAGPYADDVTDLDGISSETVTQLSPVIA